MTSLASGNVISTLTRRIPLSTVRRAAAEATPDARIALAGARAAPASRRRSERRASITAPIVDR